jgi:hypothetical protein
MEISTYDASGNTIGKVRMLIKYRQQSLTGYFDIIESIMYAGLGHWYSISF